MSATVQLLTPGGCGRHPSSSTLAVCGICVVSRENHDDVQEELGLCAAAASVVVATRHFTLVSVRAVGIVVDLRLLRALTAIPISLELLGRPT